jgi:hypothetical protein
VNYKETIFKLQRGINEGDFGFKLMYNQNQFYSPEKHKPITIHSIKMVKDNMERTKRNYIELFKSGTQLYVVFFLRNLWYTLNDKEIPVSDFPEFERQWAEFLDEHGDELP